MPDHAPELYPCKVCEKKAPASSYYWRTSKVSGDRLRSSYCKACQSAKAKARHHANKHDPSYQAKLKANDRKQGQKRAERQRLKRQQELQTTQSGDKA